LEIGNWKCRKIFRNTEKIKNQNSRKKTKINLKKSNQNWQILFGNTGLNYKLI